MEDFRVRQAVPADEPALLEIDVRTWAPDNAVSPPPDPALPFFDVGHPPEQFLVAERRLARIPGPGRLLRLAVGSPVGFIRVVQPVPLPSGDHVRQIQGFAVHPDAQGSGVGRLLLEGACAWAHRQGARRLTLRVLSSNTRAMRLYEATGFVVEGVLPEEFLIEGRYVDDVLMGLSL